MPGRYGWQNSLRASPLGDLFPVVLDAARAEGTGSLAPGHFTLTQAGTAESIDASWRVGRGERRTVAHASRLSLVRGGQACEGGERSPRRPRSRRIDVGARPADRDQDLRHGKSPLHGHGRRVALARGGGGPVPLSLLGSGRAVDGLPAADGEWQVDSPLLRAGSSTGGRRRLTQRETCSMPRAVLSRKGRWSCRLFRPRE